MQSVQLESRANEWIFNVANDDFRRWRKKRISLWISVRGSRAFTS